MVLSYFFDVPVQCVYQFFEYQLFASSFLISPYFFQIESVSLSSVIMNNKNSCFFKINFHMRLNKVFFLNLIPVHGINMLYKGKSKVSTLLLFRTCSTVSSASLARAVGVVPVLGDWESKEIAKKMRLVLQEKHTMRLENRIRTLPLE